MGTVPRLERLCRQIRCIRSMWLLSRTMSWFCSWSPVAPDEVEGEAGSVAASSQVLSQGDLEALASIQEELDKFGSASGEHSSNQNSCD